MKFLGGRPGFPIPNNPYSLCGRKTTLNSPPPPLLSLGVVSEELRSSVTQVKVLGGCPGLSVSP